MDRDAKWARNNVPESSGLSDAALQDLLGDASRIFKVLRLGVFGIALYVYLAYLDDHFSRFLFDDPTFWKRLLLAGIYGGAIGWALDWLSRVLIRRRLRALVISN